MVYFGRRYFNVYLHPHSILHTQITEINNKYNIQTSWVISIINKVNWLIVKMPKGSKTVKTLFIIVNVIYAFIKSNPLISLNKFYVDNFWIFLSVAVSESSCSRRICYGLLRSKSEQDVMGTHEKDKSSRCFCWRPDAKVSW